MCIIIAKNKNIQPPDEKTLKNCWSNNPDGAGYMFTKDNTVHVRKGFLSWKAFYKDYEKTSKLIDIISSPIVYHFRIATHGKIIAANCHPFAVSEKMADIKKLKSKASLAMAHNGIIPYMYNTGDVSDTMLFVADYVSKLYALDNRFFLTKPGIELLENMAQSKLVFLDGGGNLATIGKFVEESGLLFSNESYRYKAKAPAVKLSNRTKLLTWLDSSAGYVIADGQLFEADDFFADDMENLYWYDYSTDTAILTDGIYLSHDGLPIYGYDDLLAEPVFVDN